MCVQSELNNKYQLIVFGGFIRDVINKIDIDALKKKDIDVFINTGDISEYTAHDMIEQLSCKDILGKYFRSNCN